MDIIHKYFPNLSENQIRQFSQLESLYQYWNTQINVISRKDIDKLYVKHVLHSLAIAKVVEFKEGTRVLDVGTGGGFPGIPLAILFPKVNFFLVDSIGKKIKVVNEIVGAISLNNVSTIHERAENISGNFDFIVSRAVTNMADFKACVKGKFSSKHNNKIHNGILYLKGGDLNKELEGISNHQYHISDYFEEEFFDTKKVVYLSYGVRN